MIAVPDSAEFVSALSGKELQWDGRVQYSSEFDSDLSGKELGWSLYKTVLSLTLPCPG